MKNAAKIFLLALALGGIAGGAEAGTVKTTTAELSTPAGAEQVYQRIYEAAKTDCEDQFVSPYAVKTKMRYQRCLRASVKHMVSDVGHTNLDLAYVDAANHHKAKAKPVLTARRSK